MSLVRIALWGPLLVAALLIGGYVYLHDPFARDGTELLQVPLSEGAPALDRVGDLKYLGGLDIPRMGQNIGGLSGLRWDAGSGRLLAITDDARWVWIAPEEAEGRLIGISKVESGPLLGLDGDAIKGKEEGDSESLTRSANGGWLIGFEREHRIWHYPKIDGAPRKSELLFDPAFWPQGLKENAGVETLAGDEAANLVCIEDISAKQSNCVAQSAGTDVLSSLDARPPREVRDRGGVPTDADQLGNGDWLILFRSYSPAEGNTAAIVAYAPDGTRREIATFLPPLTLDNFEGLAVREEEDKTFLYIVSDDNFSGSQATLLMKFEFISPAED